VDEASLQKYLRQFQNGLGIDYMKLWTKVETLHAPAGLHTHRATLLGF